MDRQDGFDGFEFEQNGLFDDDVGLVGAFEAEVLADDWERDFAFEIQAGVVELPAEALAVDGLEKAGTEAATLMPRPMMWSVRFGCLVVPIVGQYRGWQLIRG
jgi:hypothetical protein